MQQTHSDLRPSRAVPYEEVLRAAPSAAIAGEGQGGPSTLQVGSMRPSKVPGSHTCTTRGLCRLVSVSPFWVRQPCRQSGLMVESNSGPCDMPGK